MLPTTDYITWNAYLHIPPISHFTLEFNIFFIFLTPLSHLRFLPLFTYFIYCLVLCLLKSSLLPSKPSHLSLLHILHLSLPLYLLCLIPSTLPQLPWPKSQLYPHISPPLLYLFLYLFLYLAVGDVPTARSGHRMVVWRNYILLFGGFYEALREVGDLVLMFYF